MRHQQLPLANSSHNLTLQVNKLIDELQAAIRNYKGHLCELAPQLQAEQEQCAAYVYQHIKELPASTSLAQSLQLKVSVAFNGFGNSSLI